MAEGKLSAVKVKSLCVGKAGDKVTFTADGNGLYLRTGGGRAGWMFRYRVGGGKERWVGLGATAEVSLAEAREAARACREQMRRGEDPLAVRRAAKAEREEVAERTFEAVARLFIETHAPSWRNPKHRQQWENTLQSLVYPIIGSTPVAMVGTIDVLRALQPHWARVPETASRVRGRIEQILDFARARGWRQSENPARWRGGLKGVLPPPRRTARVVHQPALPWKRVPAFVQALRGVAGIAARAFEFAILTAARSGEVRGMTWNEVDFAESLWTVPAQRMKAGKLHRVPLSEAAVAVLLGMLPPGVEVGDVRLRGLYVFPGAKRDTPLSDMSISMMIRRMNGESDPPIWCDASGRPAVPHGMRSAFRDWCSEAAGAPREVSESALAHVNADRVEAAYARSDHLEARRRLMQQWGAFATGPAIEIGRVVLFSNSASKAG